MRKPAVPPVEHVLSAASDATPSVLQGAQYVCFNGPEKELPQGDTTYGTSLPLEKAMYDGNDILVRVAHAICLCKPKHSSVPSASTERVLSL